MSGQTIQRKLVILDRDGVINEDSDAYVKSAAEWRPIAGSIEAIARLSQEGYTVAVATNQSGLARGLFGPAELDAMHDKMRKLVAEAGGRIDGVFHCPHGPDEGCDCRKPEVGLVRQIERALGIPATQAWFVGDTDKDMLVALATGAAPLLVRTGKGERTIAAGRIPQGVAIFADLSAAVEHILRQA